MSRCKLPIIRDIDGECKKAAGLKQLDRIHRALPTRATPVGDLDVLQDEAGFAILDDPAGDFIYDDFPHNQP